MKRENVAGTFMLLFVLRKKEERGEIMTGKAINRRAA